MSITCITYYKPSRMEADQFLRQRTSPTYLAIGEDVEQLQRVLSAFLHGPVTEYDLDRVINLQAELYEARTYGTHPNICTNLARTVDNTAQVIEDTETNLDAAIKLLLDNARIGA